jgi:hypothetical protein
MKTKKSGGTIELIDSSWEEERIEARPRQASARENCFWATRDEIE